MKDIGLARGTVVVVPHDPQWVTRFNEEKAKLQQAFGNKIIAIEHIGSTSVPSLAAKPLIDMMAVIPQLSDYANYVGRLRQLGYEFMPDRVFGDRVFLPKGPPNNRTYHLSLVEKDSSQWNDAIKFRDYLRTHESERVKYQELKIRLAGLYANNRRAYTDAKNEFIADALIRATDE
jgi:GrpB-like predicted nucleotidyltransferase (UPF0157 family)